jgi:crossover junction endodeoxyribonuclease RusA
MSIQITFPWPPTANTYWRRKGNRYFISSKGIQFREITQIICLPYKNYFKDSDRISMVIDCYPPDNRRRDLDNLGKATADALQFAGFYKDDSQIDYLSFRRCSPNLGLIKITLGLME